MICTTCNDEYVCHKCICTSHLKHTCTEIEAYLDLKKKTFSKLLKGADKKLSAVEGKLRHVQQVKDENKKNVDYTIKEVKAKGRRLKMMIDTIMEECIQQCKDVEKKNQELLVKMETKLNRYLAELNTALTKCRSALNSQTYKEFDVLENDLRSEIVREMETFPTLQIPNLGSDSETPSKEQLKVVHGSIDTQEWKHGDSCNNTGLVDTDDLSPVQPFTLMVMAQFDLPVQKYVRSIAPVTENKAWLVCGGSNEAHLATTSGDIKQSVTVDTGVWITDVLHTNTSKRTIVCCGDGSIQKIRPNGTCEILFQTMCYANSITEPYERDAILVCRHKQGNIVKYNTKSGKSLITIEKDKKGDPLFIKPVCVRLNQTTGDIAILEANAPRHVIIVDKDLKVVSRYYGDSLLHEMGRTEEEPDDDQEQPSFQPWDVCFDNDNNLVIADGGTKSLVIIDRLGKTVRTILSDDVGPTSLGIHEDGDLWVGFDYGNVKVIRYSLNQ